MNTWPCKHVVEHLGDWAIKFDKDSPEYKVFTRLDGWVQCPVCLAKRPEEPMSLADKFLESWGEDTPNTSPRESFEEFVVIAKDHYFGREQQDELAQYIDTENLHGSDEHRWSDLVAKRVCEWFRQIK